jgi:hypothetical protein
MYVFRDQHTNDGSHRSGVDRRPRTVLHVSPDPDLALSRHQVLTAIGCHVVHVRSEGEALFEISLGRCGILLLCHKLSHPARAALAETFHRRCPDPYIVAVLAHESDRYPPQAHATVVYAADHAALASLFRERLAA